MRLLLDQCKVTAVTKAIARRTVRLSLSTRPCLMQAIRVLAALERAPSGHCVALERAPGRVDCLEGEKRQIVKGVDYRPSGK